MPTMLPYDENTAGIRACPFMATLGDINKSGFNCFFDFAQVAYVDVNKSSERKILSNSISSQALVTIGFPFYVVFNLVRY